MEHGPEMPFPGVDRASGVDRVFGVVVWSVLIVFTRGAMSASGEWLKNRSRKAQAAPLKYCTKHRSALA